jgi:hypothetical protein
MMAGLGKARLRYAGPFPASRGTARRRTALPSTATLSQPGRGIAPHTKVTPIRKALLRDATRVEAGPAAATRGSARRSAASPGKAQLRSARHTKVFSLPGEASPRTATRSKATPRAPAQGSARHSLATRSIPLQG